MDLADVQRLTCSLPAVSFLSSLTQSSTPNRPAVICLSGGMVRLGPATTALQQQHPHTNRSRSRLDNVT